MKEKAKIAVFASGSGSNFEALEKASREGELDAEIVLVITDKPASFVVERARESGHPSRRIGTESIPIETGV